MRVFTWRSRVSFASFLAAVSLGFTLAGLANPPQDPPPAAARVVLLGIASALALLVVRSLSLAVVVTADEVRVRNVLRTARVPRSEIGKVVIEDHVAVSSRPFLQLVDGQTVRISALSRIKNRAWGDEKITRDRTRELASALEVPIDEDPGAVAGHGFG